MRGSGLGPVLNIRDEAREIGQACIQTIDAPVFVPVHKIEVVGAVRPADVGVFPALDRALGAKDEKPSVAPMWAGRPA